LATLPVIASLLLAAILSDSLVIASPFLCRCERSEAIWRPFTAVQGDKQTPYIKASMKTAEAVWCWCATEVKSWRFIL